jgi:hypothetical protein
MRTLTLYPKRRLNTADHAHDAKGVSASDYSQAMTSQAVRPYEKKPCGRTVHTLVLMVRALAIIDSITSDLASA